jgi:hypothetical protein
MCEDLLGTMEALWQPDIDTLCRRKFDASPILHNLSTSCLDRYQDLLDISPASTARINAQAPLRAQGWHQDYVPEALVCYPEGEGVIDFAVQAKSIREARSYISCSEGEIMQIDIGLGDIAIIGCGAEVFHRGRNTGCDIRRTLVLHDPM